MLTEEIVLVHHTDCGMLTFRDDPLKDQITAEVGIRPPFALEIPIVGWALAHRSRFGPTRALVG